MKTDDQRPHTSQQAVSDDKGRDPAVAPNFYSDWTDQRAAWRRLVSELFGTTMLTLVAAGADVISAGTGESIGQAARVVAPGLLVMALIYALGDVSGAHFNPVVTLAFALRGDFPWRRVPGYWLVQFVGAVLAAIYLRVIFGPVGHLGATLPSRRYGDVPAVLMEVVLTCLLVTVILGTAHQSHIVGHNAALAVGATIALCGLFASPISGASMNPARSFGPALIGGYVSTMWIYLVGPLAGALAAVGLAWIFHGQTTPQARKAATGS